VVRHHTVHASSPRLRRRLAPLALVAVAALATAAPAAAVPAPDISGSGITCVDSDGGVLKGGDDVKCTIKATVAADTQAATISGTVTLPPELDLLSAPGPYDSGTRTITFSKEILGLTFTGQQRTIDFHVTVASGLGVGTPLSVSGELTGVGDVDATVVHQSVASPALLVSPLVADFTTSAVGCSDINGGTLLPGESVSCQVDVMNPLEHEDAASVTGSLLVAGATWLSGGTNTGPSSTTFGTDDLGTVASGETKSVSATFKVPATALGGTFVTATAFVGGVSTPSATPFFIGKGATPLPISPGPARIGGSLLACSDTNGGVLLAGDDLECTVAVRPAAGYEDVSAASAVVQIPADARYVSGGDSHTAGEVTLAETSLGDVAAGAVKAATFHLKVAEGTVVGTFLQPEGTLTATSVPLGGPVQAPLTAQSLVVGRQVVQVGETPTIPDLVETPVTPPVTPPVTVSKAYKLKAKTIKIVMRKGRRRVVIDVRTKVTRTPKGTGKVARKLKIAKKGKTAPKRGKVTVKGTKFTYVLKKGKKAVDNFRYTVTDANGKKVTGKVTVRPKKTKKKK
jgi:Bacterial Ig domain